MVSPYPGTFSGGQSRGALSSGSMLDRMSRGSLLEAIADATKPAARSDVGAMLDRTRALRRRGSVPASHRPGAPARPPKGRVPSPLGRALGTLEAVAGVLPELGFTFWPGAPDTTKYRPPAGSILQHRCTEADNIGPSRLIYAACNNPRTILKTTYENSIPGAVVHDLGSTVRREWTMWQSAVGISGDDHVSAVQASQWEVTETKGELTPLNPPQYDWSPFPIPDYAGEPHAKPQVERGPARERAPEERIIEVSPKPGTKPDRFRTNKPPPAGRRNERKVFAYPPWMGVVLDLTTESADFIESLWEALPEDCQRGRGAAAKVADLARCWDRLDVVEALQNLVYNAIEDAIAGRISRARSRAGRDAPIGGHGQGQVGFGFRVGRGS